MGNELWPVFEFRPLPDGGVRTLYRYAGGLWIPDDGEWDISFYGDYMAYYVEIPYQKNILWKWTTQHWSGFEPQHPGGNAWHYYLRGGETDWGGQWDRYAHENERVGRLAMSECCSKYHCANGRAVEFKLDDPYMFHGLVRNRETKEIVVPPSEPECMYCGLDWLVKKKMRQMNMTLA